MGYTYRYKQTLVLLKNKYPENLFFCKKKIKKYNYLFEENDWIIKKTKKNLALCSFQQYRQAIDQKFQIGIKKRDPFHSKKATGAKLLSMNMERTSLLSKQQVSGYDSSKKFILLYTFDQLYSKLLFHGSGYKRVSYFFEKIRENKKLKILYGYYNRKYLRKQYKNSAKYNFSSQSSKISVFEFNINFILCRTGFYADIQKAEQMIKHGHYLVNNKNIFSTHMEIKSGDLISIKKNYTSESRGIKFTDTPPKNIKRHPNFFYKKLSIETNKLKHRYYLSDSFVNHRKTFYILQKFH